MQLPRANGHLSELLLEGPVCNLLCYSFLFFFFLAALGLRCCTRAFSSCGEWGLLFLAVCRVLVASASLVAGHGL